MDIFLIRDLVGGTIIKSRPADRSASRIHYSGGNGQDCLTLIHFIVRHAHIRYPQCQSRKFFPPAKSQFGHLWTNPVLRISPHRIGRIRSQAGYFTTIHLVRQGLFHFIRRFFIGAIPFTQIEPLLNNFSFTHILDNSHHDRPSSSYIIHILRSEPGRFLRTGSLINHNALSLIFGIDSVSVNFISRFGQQTFQRNLKSIIYAFLELRSRFPSGFSDLPFHFISNPELLKLRTARILYLTFNRQAVFPNLDD